MLRACRTLGFPPADLGQLCTQRGQGAGGANALFPAALQAFAQRAALGLAEQMSLRAQQADDLLVRQLRAPGKLGGCRLLDRLPVGRGGGSS
ncbi:hypothetical protein ASF90_10820 [Xanthomonas sp. Leaf148]|nr:hypothetical protein ASF90_10820 [Xanthomonas sp. Leaf148]